MNRISIGASLVIFALAGCSSATVEGQSAFGKFDRVGDDAAIGGAFEGDTLADLAFEEDPTFDPWSAGHSTSADDEPSVAAELLDDEPQGPPVDLVTHTFDDSDMTDDGVFGPDVPPEL